MAWAADDRTLFYVTEDEAKRPYRLYRHALGRRAPTTCVYEETDELFRLGVGRTRSRALPVPGLAQLHHHRGALPARRRARRRRGRWSLPREQEHEYDVDHHGGDRFYIRTNDGGRRNFRLVTAPGGRPAARALERADRPPRRT